MTTLNQQIQTIAQQARQASNQLSQADDNQKSATLLYLAKQIDLHREKLQIENQKDLVEAHRQNLSPALVDRLTLSDKTINNMIAGLKQIASMPSPVGCQSSTRILPNGIKIAQMRIPLGVIGIIYESRPNVTIDAAALCLKSGNATILRGGSEAFHSNLALTKLIQTSLLACNLPIHSVQMIPSTNRQAVTQLVKLSDEIDVIIPRGGKGLLAHLKEESRIPMIMHLDGNCHVYIDKQADLDKAYKIALNAKTYRYAICGAMETLLIHKDIAPKLLPQLAQSFYEKGVELRGCPYTLAIIPEAKAATPEDWETEYLAPILAIRIVNCIDEAIAHIAQYSSGHTESIVTQDLANARRFQNEVDSSSVYVNLPTVFADGYEYGLGAEIGISTNRLHARGPVGLEGLTTYKWILEGEGQLRH